MVALELRFKRNHLFSIFANISTYRTVDFIDFLLAPSSAPKKLGKCSSHKTESLNTFAYMLERNHKKKCCGVCDVIDLFVPRPGIRSDVVGSWQNNNKLSM